MVTYLHQIIAVDQDIELDAKRVIAEAARISTVGGKQDPMTGLRRTFHSDDPVRWPEKPAETRLVQFTAADLLGDVRTALIRLWDVKLTREAGNAAAKANLVLDGETILEDVPAGFLLFLEGRLKALISDLIDKLSARDPAETWHGQETDPNLQAGWYATDPRVSPTDIMTRQAQVLWEPSVEQIQAGYTQPAQVQPYESRVVTGSQTLIEYSGQLSKRDIQQLRERASAMLRAVRYAREQANMLEVDNKVAAAIILGRIFGDLLPSA